MVFIPNIEHDEHEMEWQCTSHFPKKTWTPQHVHGEDLWLPVVSAAISKSSFSSASARAASWALRFWIQRTFIIIKQYSMKQHKVSNKGYLKVLSITFTSIMVSIEAKYLDHQSNMLSSGSSSSISSPFFFFFFFFSLSFSSSFCRCRWCRDAYIILNVVA